MVAEEFGSVKIEGEKTSPKIASPLKEKSLTPEVVNPETPFVFWGVKVNNGSGFEHGTWNGGDVEIIDPNYGVILRSPNGTRYRIRVKDNGSIKCEVVT